MKYKKIVLMFFNETSIVFPKFPSLYIGLFEAE